MSRERNRRILFISGVGLAQRGMQLLATVITVPIVLHHLGVAGFGIWGAATSLGLLASLLDLGLGNALLTLLPRAIATGQAEQAQRYVSAALLGGFIFPLLVLAGGVTLVASGVLHRPSLPFIVAGTLLALNIPLNIARDIWFGLQKGQVAGYWDFTQSLLVLAFLVAAASFGGGVAVMVAAVYASMLLTNAASLTHVLLRHEMLRPGWRVERAAFSAVLTQGSAFFAAAIAGSCAYSFDNLIALKLLGPEASAQMAIAMRICLTALSILNIVTQPFWPAFVEAVSIGDRNWLRRALVNGAAAQIALACAGSLLIIAFGARLLQGWLHQDLHISKALLWVMASWIVAINLPRIPSLLLNAVLWLRPQILLLSITSLLGFGFKYFAARWFGVAGILAVTALIWLLAVAPAYFWLAWRAIAVLPAAAPAEAEAQTVSSAFSGPL